MNTGPFVLSLSAFQQSRARVLADMLKCYSSYFLGDGKEFFCVPAHGFYEVVVRRGYQDPSEGGVVARQFIFGHTREVLPAYGIALAGEGVASDQAQVHGEVLFFGEVYEDVEGTGGAFAVAGEVAGPGLFHAAAPGGVVAEPDQRGVARVSLVELQGEVVRPAVCEAFHQGGRGALGTVLQQDESSRVIPLGELVEGHVSGPYGILDGPEEHHGRDTQGVVAVDVVVHQVAGEDDGLQRARPFFVQRQYSLVLLAHDPKALYERLYLDKAVGYPGSPGVAYQSVEGIHVQRAEQDVP